MSEKKQKVSRTQWLSITEREALYKSKWPEFSEYILTDHRGLKKSEQINVAKHLAKLTKVSESSIRKDLRTIRQRLIKGKALSDMAIYPIMQKIKRVREAMAKGFLFGSLPYDQKETGKVLNAEVVKELTSILTLLTDSIDKDSLGELHDNLLGVAKEYREKISNYYKPDDEIPF